MPSLGFIRDAEREEKARVFYDQRLAQLAIQREQGLQGDIKRSASRASEDQNLEDLTQVFARTKIKVNRTGLIPPYRCNALNPIFVVGTTEQSYRFFEQDPDLSFRRMIWAGSDVNCGEAMGSVFFGAQCCFDYWFEVTYRGARYTVQFKARVGAGIPFTEVVPGHLSKDEERRILSLPKSGEEVYPTVTISVEEPGTPTTGGPGAPTIVSPEGEPSLTAIPSPIQRALSQGSQGPVATLSTPSAGPTLERDIQASQSRPGSEPSAELSLSAFPEPIERALSLGSQEPVASPQLERTQSAPAWVPEAGPTVPVATPQLERAQSAPAWVPERGPPAVPVLERESTRDLDLRAEEGPPPGGEPSAEFPEPLQRALSLGSLGAVAVPQLVRTQSAPATVAQAQGGPPAGPAFGRAPSTIDPEAERALEANLQARLQAREAEASTWEEARAQHEAEALSRPITPTASFAPRRSLPDIGEGEFPSEMPQAIQTALSRAKLPGEEPTASLAQEAETKAHAQQEAEATARAQEARQAQQEAETKARAQQEAEARAQKEADVRAQKEAEARAQEAEAKARAQKDAEARAQEAEAKTRAEEAEAKARAQKEAETRAEQEAKTRAQEAEVETSLARAVQRREEQERDVRSGELLTPVARRAREERSKLLEDLFRTVTIVVPGGTFGCSPDKPGFQVGVATQTIEYFNMRGIKFVRGVWQKSDVNCGITCCSIYNYWFDLDVRGKKHHILFRAKRDSPYAIVFGELGTGYLSNETVAQIDTLRGKGEVTFPSQIVLAVNPHDRGVHYVSYIFKRNFPLINVRSGALGCYPNDLTYVSFSKEDGSSALTLQKAILYLNALGIRIDEYYFVSGLGRSCRSKSGCCHNFLFILNYDGADYSIKYNATEGQGISLAETRYGIDKRGFTQADKVTITVPQQITGPEAEAEAEAKADADVVATGGRGPGSDAHFRAKYLKYKAKYLALRRGN